MSVAQSTQQHKLLSIVPSQDEESNDLLTVREVAHILRVDDTTVRRWVKTGVLHAICLPHRNTRQAYRIKRGTLDKILTGAALTL